MSFQKNTGAVRRFGKLMRFASWLQALPHKLTPAPFRLIQLGSAFWQSRALYVAAQLDLATVLGDNALAVDDLATRVGADADALARLLRLLVAMGVFAQPQPQIFSNNKLSRYLRADEPGNVRAMILLHNSDALSRPWFEQLEAGVRTGEPAFYLSHGDELFTYLDQHADVDRQFSQAMDSVEALTGDCFATDFDWSRFDRFYDVGGSRGGKAMAILKRHPHLKAVVVDREQVVAEAQRYWATHPCRELERLRFQVGDVLSALPTAQDQRELYFMSAVLHGMDDVTAMQALRRVGQAMGDSGARLAILEMVLPETGADVAAASFDMQMFVNTRGRERSLVQWRALLEQGGMALEEVVGLQTMGSILVAQPKK